MATGVGHGRAARIKPMTRPRAGRISSHVSHCRAGPLPGQVGEVELADLIIAALLRRKDADAIIRKLHLEPEEGGLSRRKSTYTLAEVRHEIDDKLRVR